MDFEKLKRESASHIFAHQNLQSFLGEYVESAKKLKSSWSLGSWAKSLDQPTTASVSRVLQAQRSPTISLVDGLQRYFKFSDLESEYFYFLVLKAKADSDPLLARLLSNKFWHGSSPKDLITDSDSTGAVDSRPISLQIHNGNILCLICEANLDAVNGSLKSENLEAVNFSGKAKLALNFCEYVDSSVGPYSEFYISIYAKRPEDDITEMGLVFRNLYANHHGLANLGRIVWGSNYKMGQIESTQNKRKLLGEGGQALIEFTADTNLQWTSGVDGFDLSAFSNLTGARTKHEIRAKFQSQEANFSPNCELRISGNFEHKAFCDAIGMEPVQWIEFSQLKCETWAPKIGHS